MFAQLSGLLMGRKALRERNQIETKQMKNVQQLIAIHSN
jgi:hypothetical protein